MPPVEMNSSGRWRPCRGKARSERSKKGEKEGMNQYSPWRENRKRRHDPKARKFSKASTTATHRLQPWILRWNRLLFQRYHNHRMLRMVAKLHNKIDLELLIHRNRPRRSISAVRFIGIRQRSSTRRHFVASSTRLRCSSPLERPHLHPDGALPPRRLDRIDDLQELRLDSDLAWAIGMGHRLGAYALRTHRGEDPLQDDGTAGPRQLRA